MSALLQELESWKGTPFKHRTGVKGLGCDCINFVINVYHNLGILDKNAIKLPDYSRDWFLHKDRNLLLEYLNNNPDIESVTTVKNGDILVFYFKSALCHVGIYYDGKIYQVTDDCFTISEYAKWKNRHKLTYRIKQ